MPQLTSVERRLGNFKPVDKPGKPAPFAPADEADQQRDQAWLDAQEDPAELVEAEDEFADDAFLEQYRQGI